MLHSVRRFFAAPWCNWQHVCLWSRRVLVRSQEGLLEAGQGHTEETAPHDGRRFALQSAHGKRQRPISPVARLLPYSSGEEGRVRVAPDGGRDYTPARLFADRFIPGRQVIAAASGRARPHRHSTTRQGTRRQHTADCAPAPMNGLQTRARRHAHHAATRVVPTGGTAPQHQGHRGVATDRTRTGRTSDRRRGWSTFSCRRPDRTAARQSSR